MNCKKIERLRCGVVNGRGTRHGNTSTMPDFVMPLPPPINKVDMEDSASMVSISSSRGPSQQLLEVEMTRMTMCTLLNNRVIEVNKELAELAMNPIVEEVVEENKQKRGNTSKVKGKEKSTLKTEIIQNFPGLQNKISKHINIADIVAATYLCDFGNVIIGQSRKKAFKITNASILGQLNWNFDTTKITAQGFMIEPFKAPQHSPNMTRDTPKVDPSMPQDPQR